MRLLTLGINHHTAPVELRERIAFDPEQQVNALQELATQHGADAAVILSTCNRTEIYIDGDLDSQTLLEWLYQFHQLAPGSLDERFYIYEHEEAVAHLMNVACGLDSMVMGEPQILGQVKQAYSQARAAGVLNTEMERLLDRTLSVAKQVRTDTEIGTSAVSVAYAAVNLAKHIFGELERARVLLIGAGETITLVARHLQEQNVATITVANRTIERANTLASECGGKAITLQQVTEHLPSADIVIGSTASPLPIVGVGAIEKAIKARRYQPMLLVDLAVPRDIEPEVNDLEGAFLYTVDDLQRIVSQNMEARQEAARLANDIIAQQAQAFMQWLDAQQSVDLVKNYRQQGNDICDELLTKARQALEQGQNPDTVLTQLAHKLANRLMHGPTKALQQAALHGDSEGLQHLAVGLGLANELPSQSQPSAAKAAAGAHLRLVGRGRKNG